MNLFKYQLCIFQICNAEYNLFLQEHKLGTVYHQVSSEKIHQTEQIVLKHGLLTLKKI